MMILKSSKIVAMVAAAAAIADVSAFATTSNVRRGQGMALKARPMTTTQLVMVSNTISPVAGLPTDLYIRNNFISKQVNDPAASEGRGVATAMATALPALVATLGLLCFGGTAGSAAAALPNSMLTMDNLVLGLVICAVGNGIPMAVSPHTGSTIYDLDTSRGTLDNWIVGCLGCFALNMGFTTFLAVSKGMHVATSIAVGCLPFLIYVLKDVMTGEFRNANMNGASTIVNAGIAAVLSFVVLAGGNNASIAAKVLSLMYIPQGLLAYANPVGAAKLLVQKDLSKQDKSKALFVGYGALRSVSGIICAGLAFGLRPIRAVGFGNLVYASMLAEAMLFRKLHLQVGVSKRASMRFNMVLCFASAFWMLLAP